MKGIKILIICLILAAFTMCDKGKEKLTVKTDYYDLPSQSRKKLAFILKTEDLSALDSTSVPVLREFITKNLINGTSPFGRWITSKYFWHVYNALPDFVDKNERHSGYYRDERKKDHDERLLAYALYRIDRSPENIEKIYSIVKPVMKRILTPQQYSSIHADNYVAGLIGSYEFLHKRKDCRSGLSKFYDKYFTEKGAMKLNKNKDLLEISKSAYGVSAYDLSELLYKELGFDRNAPFYASPHVLFWMRRNHEGNMDAVYKILKDVQVNYRGQ